MKNLFFIVATAAGWVAAHIYAGDRNLHTEKDFPYYIIKKYEGAFTMNKIQLNFLRFCIANSHKLTEEEFDFLMDLSENKESALSNEQNAKLNKIQRKLTQ